MVPYSSNKITLQIIRMILEIPGSKFQIPKLELLNWDLELGIWNFFYSSNQQFALVLFERFTSIRVQ